jgi:hypothetical protein
MIAPNISKGQKKRITARTKAQQAHQVAQITINAVLWYIIKQNGETPDDDAILTIPKTELDGVPALFNLQVTSDDDNMFIKASEQEEKRIIQLKDL